MNVSELIDGYAVGKPLCSHAKTSVHAATRESDGYEVVLKVYQDAQHGLERARQELEVLRACRHPRIPEALELLDVGRPVLVLQRIPGRTLADRIADEPLAIADALTIALDLAGALEAVHAARRIHQDVTPANVVLHQDTGAAYLIDFDAAIALGTAAASSTDRERWLLGNPLYVAPEQTGWINQGRDSRTDLYSLGATLYHALTGQPPFDETDPTRLVHAQVAREPTPPEELRADVPAALSRVLLKLLRKEPADRYGDARSLCADLERLHAEWARSGRLSDDFVPGGSSTLDRPRFGTTLYGRSDVLERLRAAWHDVGNGAPRAVFLHGRAGTGRSAVLSELRRMIAASGGSLAASQFSPGSDQPYAGWAGAFRSLLSQILVEGEERFQQRRAALHEELGNIAGALFDLIPDLAFILPDAPPVPRLGPRQALDRLALAFERLVRGCATREQPLAILLDDLQWSDPGSQVLLRRLLCARGFEGLLILGSFVDEDSSTESPVTQLLDELRQDAVDFESIELLPLDAAGARRMLADALGRSEEDVRPLADRIARATDNTPLLVREFVDHLHAQGLIRAEQGRWTWEMDAIESAPVPDGVVDMMTAKIDRLPERARYLLELASCMANEFDVERLKQVGELDSQVLEPALSALLDAGLLIPSPGGFRFAHDRIREAGRQCCPEPVRAEHHYKIGRWLLERHPDAAASARVFEIADHLNHAGERGLELRVPLLELNVAAGKRALASGAGPDAAAYLELAHRAFRDDDWAERHALGFDLHMDWVESLIQVGDYVRALAVLDDLDGRQRSRLEFAQIANKRIYIYGLTQPLDDSIRYVLDALRKLGIRWPLHPSFLRVRLSLLWLRWETRGQRLEDVLRPNRAPDLDRLAPLLLLNAAGAQIARVDTRLSALVTSMVTREFLRHGYSASPAVVLASLASSFRSFLHDDATARQMAESALHYVTAMPDPINGPRAEYQVHGLLYPWYVRRRRALRDFERIAGLLNEAGDPEWAHYARFSHALYRVLSGDPVHEVESELELLVEDVRRTGKSYQAPAQMLLAYRLLSPESREPEIEEKCAEYESWIATNDDGPEPMLRTVWMLVLCVYRRFDLAFTHSEAVYGKLFYRLPYVHLADHMLYRGLAAAHLAGLERGRARRRRLRVVRACRDHLRRWAQSGPDFRHMALMLEAEHAGLRAQSARALQLYRDAASAATDQKFPHHAAFAQEQRGRLLVAVGRISEAERVLDEATRLYASWGAQTKKRSLERDRFELTPRGSH